MSRNFYYFLFVFSLLLTWSIKGNTQDVPELMYFKFNTSTGNQTPNEANPVTRLGGANATMNGNLTTGGTGQFGTGLLGVGAISTSANLNAGWTGSYTGSWTISMYLDVTALSSTQYFFGSVLSSSFRCFTGGVAYDGVLLRGTGITDVLIPDLYPGPVVATFAYDANTSTIKAYKNGVLVVTETNWISPALQGSDFQIAGYSSNNGLNGIMDEFRFYNRALGDAEVAATWDQTLPLTNCSGQPNLGAISGPTDICGGTAFSLGATGINAAGVTYQWQESNPGANAWTDIPGAVAGSLGFPNGLNSPMDYRVIATCTNSNLSDTSAAHSVDILPANACYCIPPPPSISGLYWIDGVITTGGLNNINNTGTGASANGYMDYSGSHSVSTFAGGDFDLEIQSQNGATAGVKVWIDWNMNGVFEASELVYTSTAGSSSTLNIYNTNIQVPANVTPGATRMRIRNYTGQEPCNLVSYGEAEDYEVLFISLANCSAADAGTISSNKTDVCADESFTLTTTGATSPGTGLTYQWQSSPAGANTWTDITNANSLSYTGTGVTGNTDFRLKVNCSFGNLESISNVVSVDETPANQCYCTPPPPTYNTLYWIENVTTTGGINNISNLGTGFSPGGYADYTGIHNVTTFAGGDFDLEMHAQSGGAPGIKVWIDWNQNGVFEASELVYNSTAGSSSTLNVYNTNIQVPANVTPGSTRMRIRNYTGQEPCNQVAYGEAEDYEVVFITLANCSDADAGTISSNKTQVCADENFTLSTTGATSPGTGLTYQWQSSPAGANTWTDIAGANSMNYTGTGVTGETDFRLKVNCSFGNLEDISNVVTIDESPATDCYCMPSATSGEYLSHIGIETDIDDHLYTVSAQPINPVKGYDDQSNITIMTYAGDDVEVNTTYVGGSNTVKVWVDWNQNGVFEANELMAEGYTSGASQSFTFAVPAGAAAGDYRIRTRARWSTTVFTPCDVQTYGSAVDFTLQLISLANCTDADAGTIASNKTQVCSDEDFVLTTTGATGPGTGLTYQWQSSPAGANTWSDITNANSTSYTSTGVNGSTDFRLKVNCSFGNLEDISNVVTVDQSPASNCYCTPQYSTDCSVGDDLSNVKLVGETVTLDNATQCSPNGYADFRGLLDEPDLLAGETYTIELSTSYVSPQFEDVRAWIDWNQNGTFEPGEEIANSMGNGMAPGTYTETFTVPAGTPNGLYTMRARVVYSGGANIDPCAMATYGEAQDYHIIVGALCDDPIVNLGPDVTICAGSSVTLDAGNPGLEYEWSNNATTQTITVTQAGTYTVTVYDGDCSTTESITVTVQDLPIVDLGNDKTICDGDVITLDADNAGADFLWSDNSTGQTLDVNQAGTYHVTVTEGVCSASDTVNVDYYPVPTAGGIIVTEQGECTFTFSVDNPQNVNYFEWNFGDGTIPTIGPLASHTYTSEGQFTVTLTLKNECDDEVQFTYVVFCEGVGIDDLDAGKNAITLYPNPTTERITLESSNNAVMESITVYNVLGQVVYENAAVNAAEHIVDVAQLASGVYTVRIQTNQGYVTRKFEIIK